MDVIWMLRNQEVMTSTSYVKSLRRISIWQILVAQITFC